MMHFEMKMTLLLLLTALVFPKATAAEETLQLRVATAEETEFFEKNVRPVLAKHCYSCHSRKAKTLHASLKLDSAHDLAKGGDSGTLLVPGNPDASLLIQAIRYGKDADYQMPPKGRMSDQEIAILTEWVQRGGFHPADSVSNPQPVSEIDIAAARNFWSFRPAQEQPLPTVSQSDWARQRLDHFVLAAMERENLSPTPEAERSRLLRRLSFDLIGLPPTPEEVAAFVEDKSPNAYERQVERLLASPHFGERWGRHWLDLARYTDRTASWLDSTGEAHLYRDWVVQAMNEDMPYDQFIHRQLATDLMPETGPEDTPALGFLGLSPNYWKELKLPAEIIKVIVADEWEERIDAVSRTFLGLTVACARCHDHKFDPITSEDYYALAGVIASSRIRARPTIDDELFAPVQAAREEVQKLEKELTALKKMKPLPEADIAALTAKIKQVKESTPHYDTPMAPAVVDEALFVERKGKTPQEGTELIYRPEARDLNLFIRGNPNRLGEVIPRRFLAVLSAGEPTPFKQGSGRLELAESLTRDAASLTARVMVNRIWLAHFGQGLVATPSNFGQSGERPSHPELLDDLAARFMTSGWSLKKLHREIVLSATYRQSSRSDIAQVEQDPDNRWLARMNRRRLDVEAWRDAMLAATGELDRTLGGPSIELTDAKNIRRTIYSTIHRREMSTMLLMHDFPDPTAHSSKRQNTTTALQGLYALNGPLFLDRAEALAKRLATDFPNDDTARIHHVYRLLYSREPTSREVEIGLAFLGETTNLERETAWMQYSHVLLAANEFLFVD